GQTVGKLLTGVRVVRADGDRPPVGAVAIRTVVRLVDWLPLLYLVGFLTMLATGARRQRLGNLAARTGIARAARSAIGARWGQWWRPRSFACWAGPGSESRAAA